MTATNMCSNFGSKWYSPPILPAPHCSALNTCQPSGPPVLNSQNKSLTWLSLVELLHSQTKTQIIVPSFARETSAITCITVNPFANTFMFLHGIGRTRVKNIRCNIRMQGLLPRLHGNKHRQLHNALSFEDTEYVVCFIFSLLLPGRVPGYSRSDIQLLHPVNPREEYEMSTAKLLVKVTSTLWHTLHSVVCGKVWYHR